MKKGRGKKTNKKQINAISCQPVSYKVAISWQLDGLTFGINFWTKNTYI